MKGHQGKRQGGVRAIAVAAVLAACLALSGIAVALAPKSGRYAGRTSQGEDFEFRFKVNPSQKKVSRLTVALRMRCNVPGNAGTDTYHLGAPGTPVARIKDGHFSYANDGLVIEGEFTGRRRAEGTVRRHVKYSEPDGTRVTCDSRKRSWSATHL